jgi:hypothetical protein
MAGGEKSSTGAGRARRLPRTSPDRGRSSIVVVEPGVGLVIVD